METVSSFKLVLEDNRNIHIPLEWTTSLELGLFGYVQLTLVDDKIAIHKPLGEFAEVKAARKVGDGSYLRRLSIMDVLLPPQLMKPLDIKCGDSLVLSLEENCVAVRKDIEANTQTTDTEGKPESTMAFCCVCGNLLYTENGLKKISSKYICHKCIELVGNL